jgi:glucokinase
MAQVLALDVGGTHARIARCDGMGRGLDRIDRIATDELPPLDRIVASAVRDHGVVAACVAIAGPVRDGVGRITKGVWEARLEDFGALPGAVLNDLEAAAHAVPDLGPDDVDDLGGPEPRPGVAAVLGVGTGVGEAIVVGDEVVPGEGGHAEVGPIDEETAALAAWIRGRGERPSWDETVSGPGLERILAFATERRPLGREAREAWGRAPASVVVLAHAGRDPACALALDLQLRLLGAEAGNLALRVLPRRGLYLVGGMAQALRSSLGAGSSFERAFLDKGPMRDVVAAIPRRLVTFEEPGLLGAARVARRLAARA